ncbi:MAG: choice-of-anchor D domain-containing protein [Candidatus Firestonebacteria bacterium]|nr:choice-of-anchor D domain-containing protein [Candidatus Firestonebacteria bacterium]
MNKKNVLIILINFLLLLSIACNTSEKSSNNSNTSNTSPTPPPAPTIVYGFAENERVIIRWNPVSGAESYNLYYTLGSTASKESMKIEKVTSPYPVTGLINGNRYAFAITSVNANGESSLSPIVLAIPVAPYIYPPAKIFAAINNREVTLTWDTSIGILYNLYYAMDSTVTKIKYDQRIESIASPYPITGLINGTQYAFGITSVKENRESEISSIVLATPAATHINSPIKITAISGNEQITLKWNAVTGATSYNLYYAMDTTVTKTKYDKKVDNVTSAYPVTGLINGSEYAFGITSVNADGESDLSPIVNAIPVQSNNPPNKPTNPSPFDSAINVSINPTLSWTCNDPDNGDAIYYDVYFDTTDASIKVRENQIISTFSTTGLNFNKKYFWKIVARDKSNVETQGDVWKFTTPTGTRLSLTNAGWTNYTSGANVNAIVDEPGSLWIGGGGGLVLLNKATGNMMHYNRTNSELPDNVINALAKDLNGDIWVGTSNGLAKVDRATSTLYRQDSSFVNGQDISSIAIDEYGDKWIGTRNNGVIVFNSNVNTWHGINQLENENVNAIAVDSNGNKWIGIDGGLVNIDEVSTTTTYNSTNFKTPGNRISVIAIDIDGSVWSGGNDGLIKFDGSNWYVYNTDNSPLPGNVIRSIAIDSYGNKWVGTDNNGFFMFDGETWTDYSPSDIGIISNDILSFTIDNINGNKWVGFKGGLAKFDGINWATYNIGNSELPDNFIRSIAFDSSGNKWIGTDFGGLSNFDGANWTNYLDDLDNSGDRHIDNIKIDKNGIKWIVTRDGLVKFDGTNWISYNEYNSELPKGTIYDITIDNSNNKWMLVNDYDLKEFKLVKFDNTNWYIYNIADSIIDSGYPGKIAVDKLNNVWISISFKEDNDGNVISDNNGNLIGGGLAKFDGANWTFYNKDNSGLTTNWITSIAIDKDDNLWLGNLPQPKISYGGQVTYSGGGLVKFNGTDFTIYDTSNSLLPGNFIVYIKIDNNGNVWGWSIAEGFEEESIFKFDGKEWTLFDNIANSGVPSELGTIFDIDNNGGLWFGTRGGLGYLNPVDITNSSPNISVSPFFHDFGKAEIGSNSQIQTFVITNNGQAPLSIDMCSLTGKDDGEFKITNSPWISKTIAPSESFPVEVEFLPTSIGPKTAILSIPSDDPDMPILTVNLKGEAQDRTPLLWAKTFGEYGDDEAKSIQQTSDGGYIIVGNSDSYGEDESDIWVIKLNSDGAIEWQKIYSCICYDEASSIQQTSDGGYIVAGITHDNENGYRIWILKLDSNGLVIWQNAYGETGDDYSYSIQQTADGGYIVAGETIGETSDIWILKLDSNGSITWQKTYDNSYDEVSSIRQTADGGYIIAGNSTIGYGFSYWILKLDSYGAIEWQKAYGETGGYGDANSIQQTTDNNGNVDGYIVAGNMSGYGSSDIWILKLNLDGTIAWQKSYSGSFSVEAYTIEQTTDRGYVVAGEITGYSNSDILIFKLNSDGTIAWQKAYGGEYNDTAQSIQQTSDGGYIVGGSTYSFGAGNSDIWILKLNTNGEIVFNPLSGASVNDTNLIDTITEVTDADTTATVNNPGATKADINVYVTDTEAIINQQAP